MLTKLVESLSKNRSFWSTQRELARKAGVSPNAVNRVLNNRYALLDDSVWSKNEDGVYKNALGAEPSGRQYFSWTWSLSKIYKFAKSVDSDIGSFKDTLRECGLNADNIHVLRAIEGISSDYIPPKAKISPFGNDMLVTKGDVEVMIGVSESIGTMSLNLFLEILVKKIENGG